MYSCNRYAVEGLIEELDDTSVQARFTPSGEIDIAGINNQKLLHAVTEAQKVGGDIGRLSSQRLLDVAILVARLRSYLQKGNTWREIQLFQLYSRKNLQVTCYHDDGLLFVVSGNFE